MKTRKRHEFTKEELEKERTPVNFNNVPWRADIQCQRIFSVGAAVVSGVQFSQSEDKDFNISNLISRPGTSSGKLLFWH